MVGAGGGGGKDVNPSLASQHKVSRKHWSDPVLMSGDCGCTVSSLFCISFEYRYGLTGTPLQNKLGRFWCALDWANPGSLGKAKQFNLEFGKPIREGQRYDATKRKLALARKSKCTQIVKYEE